MQNVIFGEVRKSSKNICCIGLIAKIIKQRIKKEQLQYASLFKLLHITTEILRTSRFSAVWKRRDYSPEGYTQPRTRGTRPVIAFSSAWQHIKGHKMVLGTAILVGMLAGLTILSVSGFAVQMYLILSGKMPRSRQYMYPSHHTFVPFYHVWIKNVSDRRTALCFSPAGVFVVEWFTSCEWEK